MQSPRVDERGSRVRVAPGVFTRDGKWLISWTDLDGIDHVKTLGPIKRGNGPGFTKTEAIAAREDLRTKLRKGEIPAPTKSTLADVAADFLSSFESLVLAGKTSERTLALYQQRWRSHLEKPLGSKKVQEIRPEHVARVLEACRRKGLSEWTTTGIYTLLGSIFSHAMARGLVSESPLKKLTKTERPTGKAATKARTLSDDECKRLIEASVGEWKCMVTVAAITGLRLSELLGLRWQDVHFDSDEIRVRFQLSQVTGKKPAHLVKLKSGAGERDVILMDDLEKVLKAHRKTALAKGHARADSYVFSTRDGKPLSQRNAARALTNATERASLNPEGVQALSWHDLRHTAISRLIAAGLDVVKVQRQAGHAKPSITLDIYSHEFERAKGSDDARARIAAMGSPLS
jgi:integrase